MVKFQKIEPGPVEEMRERGWWLESPKDAHRLFPDDLFPTLGRAESIPARLFGRAQADISL